MFTGIIETLAKVQKIEQEGTNIHFTFNSAITRELKIDQSVAHNGVCLTVVGIDNENYVVTAIQETLDRTNLGELKVGDEVNLERCTQIGHRLDGHIVQGHVDQTATCTKVEENNGSWNYYFEYEPSENITVEKGSVTINGVSLTVVDSDVNTFSVSIIPYTHEHTNFKDFKVGTKVNLEFDIVGKYVTKLLKLRS
ncbi:MAG: riboflavin synthase [Flavobacteriales bacterium]|nr:riboflavin synthase [Flavobacteriales bacterium]